MLNSKVILMCVVAFATSCDRDGREKFAQPNPDFPPVVELGTIEVMTAGQSAELYAEGSAGSLWCADSSGIAREKVGDRDQAADTPLCHYGQLGHTVVGQAGGATFTFNGTGGPVCLVVDPETVFWNEAVAGPAVVSVDAAGSAPYSYPDVEEDDGDLDMFAGLSAYYTGSPGIQLGDFTGYYTDSLGNKIEIEYELCEQNGYPRGDGDNPVKAGRAAAEFCTINTENHIGVPYTVVLEKFSVPYNDSVLSYGVGVFEGVCNPESGGFDAVTGTQNVKTDECTFLGESLNLDGTVRACTPQLEASFCADWPSNSLTGPALPAFCCLHPDMCGEDTLPEDCQTVFDKWLVSNIDDLETAFCGESGFCCSE